MKHRKQGLEKGRNGGGGDVSRREKRSGGSSESPNVRSIDEEERNGRSGRLREHRGLWELTRCLPM